MYLLMYVMRLECPVWVKYIVIFRVIVIFTIITQAQQETRLTNMKTEKICMLWCFHQYTNISPDKSNGLRNRVL